MNLKKADKENKHVEILTIKAVEENNSKLLNHMLVSSGNISAIGAKSDYEFLERRADYLFKHLPESIRNLSSITEFPGKWINITLIISFVFGLLSNYLGPSKLIHVIYNPLTILLVWNILVYIFLLIKSFIKAGKYGFEKPAKAISSILPEKKDAEFEDDTNQNSKKKKSGNFIVDWLVGWLFRTTISYRSKLSEGGEKASNFKQLLLDFWKSYRDVSGKSLAYRLNSLLSISAIGLAVGALAGVYLRGMFFNYNMIWQSTFVSDPETIQTWLNIFLGVGSLLIDGQLISVETAKSLLSPEGTNAGPWIHKLALTAFLFIIMPRTLLAFSYSKLAKRKIRPLDISADYYVDILEKQRENLIEIIRDGINEIISKKIKRLGLTISDFVINDYYDKIISPILVSFREKGGKIKKLEGNLIKSQEQFEPILQRYLEELQEDFREGVLTEINLFLGRKLEIDINTSSSYQPSSEEVDRKISTRIAEEIGDTIGGTILTTVALAAGSISGGIGKSLGIAIISGLLGVSGPIGLLIGGVITAITIGGFYTVKRDQISNMVKEVPFPAFVISMTLTDSKIEKARKETKEHTEKEIQKMLKPKVSEVTENILKDLTY